MGGRLGPGNTEVFFHGLLVEFGGGALLDEDGVLGAVAEAGAETVAEVVGQKSGLAVDDPDRPFGAGGYAEAAAVALVFIYFYDVAIHGVLLWVFWFRSMMKDGVDVFDL
jgi:hypothetical protein